jgi:hypothetical protein
MNRPTLEQRAEKEDFMYHLLSVCLLKSQIKSAFRERYPGTSSRTLERYLAAARKRLLAADGKTVEERRAESRAFYEAILRNESAAPRDRLYARERIDRLYGLDAPRKIAPTDPTGVNPYAGLDKDELIRQIIIRTTRAVDEVENTDPEAEVVH